MCADYVRRSTVMAGAILIANLSALSKLWATVFSNIGSTMVTGAGPCNMPKARAPRKSACNKWAKFVQDAADGRQWVTKRFLQHGLRINGHHVALVEVNLDRICGLRARLLRELVIPRPLTIIAP